MNVFPVLIGSGLGGVSIAVIFLYLRLTASLRKRRVPLLRVLNAIAIFGTATVLIRLYGVLILGLGGASRNVAGMGLLAFALIWFAGCLWLIKIFGLHQKPSK